MWTSVVHVTDGHHVISKVETHLSDGSTRVSSHLTLETAQLLSKLHPNMFPAGSIVQVSLGYILTHWCLSDVEVILQVYSSNSLYELMSWAPAMQLALVECRRTVLMISQFWFM